MTVEFATHGGPRDTRAILEQGREWIRRHGNRGGRSVAERRRELARSEAAFRRKELDRADRRAGTWRRALERDRSQSLARRGDTYARTVAIHEASHAVVGHRLGYPVHEVRLRFDSDGRASGGAVDFDAAPDDLPAEVWLAGEEGERLAGIHRRHASYSSDRKGAAASGGNQHLARMEARIILREQFSAVRAIADALLRRGTLTGADVEALIPAHRGRRAAA